MYLVPTKAKLATTTVLIIVAGFAAGCYWDGTRTWRNETYAVLTIQGIAISLIDYDKHHGHVPTDLQQLEISLVEANCDQRVRQNIRKVLKDGEVSGYRFDYQAVGSDGFSLIAVPSRLGQTGNRTFYVDETGVARYSLESVATKSSPPVPN